MRKIVVLFCFLTPLSQAITPLESTIVETLASYKIIVDNSKNPENYRLSESITRAEAIGVALSVGDIQLPENYFCKDYFGDVSYTPLNNWICRAVEIAADNDIITRENSFVRSSSPISRIEALGITMKAGKVPYTRNIDKTHYPKNMPQWQVDILEWALQYRIIPSIESFINPNHAATRIDVFHMMYNMRFSGGRNGYIAETGAPLPPLTSAPGAKNGITIKLPGANNGSAPSLGINAQLSGFAVTAPADIYTHSPFKISVRALAPDGTTLTNYTGTLYFDLISGSSSNISPLLTEEGFTFTPDNKWIMNFWDIILKKADIYEIDIYEIGSGLDIMNTIKITAKNS